MKIGELCKEHGVVVLSDEIHCEFTNPKRAYVPFASVSDVCRDISVSCISASKAFNLAGLGAACVIAHNRDLYNRVYRGINNDEVGEPGAFAVGAVVSAFRDGEEWLDEMVDYVNANKAFAENYIKENIPTLSVPKSSATYLLWVDATALGVDSVELCEYLESIVGLKISDGLEYGECARYFVRINLATSRERVKAGLELLKAGCETLLKRKKK
jgi:cystathionine beta-lyase